MTNQFSAKTDASIYRIYSILEELKTLKDLTPAQTQSVRELLQTERNRNNPNLVDLQKKLLSILEKLQDESFDNSKNLLNILNTKIKESITSNSSKNYKTKIEHMLELVNAALKRQASINSTLYIEEEIANIYSLLKELKALKDLTPAQTKSVRELLQTEIDRNNPNLVSLQKKLSSILKNGSFANSKKSKNKIELMLKLVNEALKKQESINSATYTAEEIANIKKLDMFYQDIETKYGKLVIPVRQTFEYRNLNLGLCRGYITKWIKDFLTKQRSNGIDFLNPVEFKYISPLKPGFKKKQTLNHLYIATEEVASYQETQSVIKSVKEIAYVSELTKELAQLGNAHKNPMAFALHFINDDGGHSVGVCRDEKNKWHFFDPNVGWFVFPNQEKFIACFKDILSRRYRKYLAYQIESPKADLNASVKPASKCAVGYRDTLFTNSNTIEPLTKQQLEKKQKNIESTRALDGLALDRPKIKK